MKTAEDLGSARKTCIGKFKVSGDRVAEYKKRVFRETDPETPSYVHCVFEVLGLWRDGGFVTEDYLVQSGRAGDREKVIGCYDTTGAEPQIRAFRTFLCFLEKGLLPEGY